MHSIFRHILLILVLVGCAVVASAQDGTTAYQFLNVPVSSHVYALGGHNISIIDDDINLVEQNPALLGKEFDHQVGLNYMRYIGGTNFMGARYGQGVGEHGAAGAAIQYFGYGKMNAKRVLIISTVGLIYDGITSVISTYLEAMDLSSLDIRLVGTITFSFCFC